MIGIISDTHDNVPAVIRIVKFFKRKKLDFVIHLGDFIAPKTVTFFSGLKVKFIQGNCDGDIETTKKKIRSINCEFLGDFAELKVKGKKIAIFHGKPPEKLDSIIQSQKYDYVLHGHYHKKRDEKIGKTRVINPGSFYLDPANKDRTVALLDVEKDKVQFVRI